MAKPMDTAARGRQRVLAAFLPITAALYFSAAGLNPKGTDQLVEDRAIALQVLPIAAKHSGQLYLSGSLTLLALGSLAVSYAAIATLVRRRAATLATVAALIGGLGAYCGAIVNVLVGINLATAATANMTRDAAAQFLVASFNSAAGQGFLYVYVFGVYLGPVLMAIALWRSRTVPRWLAILFVVSLEVVQQVPSAGILVVGLLTLPFAATMVLLAVRIWRAAALPASHSAEPNLIAA
jgi:hypothetical protein